MRARAVRPRVRALLFPVGALVAATGVACASIFGLTDVPTPDDARSGSDASPDKVPEVIAPHDAGDAGRDVVEAGCNSTGWPARPEAGLAPDAADLPPFILAGTQFDLNPQDSIGLDLDGVCSCPGPQSCVLPGGAITGAACDDPHGVDAVLNHFLTTVDDFYCLPLTQAPEQGYSNVLLRISKYNGTPNDDNVVVELFASVGTPPLDDAGTPTMPKLDGTDVWLPWAQTLLNPDASAGTAVSRFADPLAYVSDSMLVAHPGDINAYAVLLWRLNAADCDGGTAISDNPLSFTARGVVITGRLTRSLDGGYSLQEGRAGARVPTDGLTGALASIERFGICPDGGLYATAQTAVCGSRDINIVEKLDNTGNECDGLSFGLAFQAVPARLGKPAPFSIPNPCGGDAAASCP